MSWEDRITEAVYTSPSGESFTGIFEDVSKKMSKKTTPFDFPDVDGTFVQDLGKKGRRYPMRWIFSGENYDKDADKFDDAIEEKGPGVLQHPLYGTFDVVPFGEITRNDNLVSAANQAVYDITFYETIKIIFPVSELAAANAMGFGFTEFTESAASLFDQALSVISANEITAFIASAKAGLRKIKKTMAKIASATASIERTFNDLADLADETITTLVGGPLLIAFQLLALIRLPSQTISSIQAKLDAYQNLLNSMIEGPSNQFEQGLDSQADNAFAIANLITSSAVLASIESTISDGAEAEAAGSTISVAAIPPSEIFTTRTQTIEAIESLDASLTQYIGWSDTNRERLVLTALPTRKAGTTDLIDTGEAYQKLLEVFSISQGRLTQIAFTALQERSVILDRDRTFIDFAAEFYGQLDEQYDFIIRSNNLTGSEIIELKKGRGMVYYV